MILSVAAILVLMKGRGAFYDLLQWRLSADWVGISTIGPAIDRYGFMVALVFGVLGWVYIGSRRVSATLHRRYQFQLKLCLLLSVAAASLLIGSIITDTVLSGLRLFEARMSLVGLIPLTSAAIELAVAGTIIVELRRVMQRKALVASLFAENNANH